MKCRISLSWTSQQPHQSVGVIWDDNNRQVYFTGIVVFDGQQVATLVSADKARVGVGLISNFSEPGDIYRFPWLGPEFDRGQCRYAG